MKSALNVDQSFPSVSYIIDNSRIKSPGNDKHILQRNQKGTFE